MRTALKFAVAHGVMILFACSSGVKGEELAQPATLAAAAPVKQDPQVKPVACCDDGNRNCCREPVCCPKCVTQDVEKSCWLVNSELVCIPGFRWPWECRDGGCDCGGEGGDGCACPPKCGRVRCVNVLEQHKYTCKECGYEWEVKCVRRGNSCNACASVDARSQSAPASRIAQKSSSLLERLGIK